jgi:hypothetical protein
MVAPSRLPAGRVVRAPVSLRALPATIADLLGWRGASPFPGSSLARTWQATGSQDRPDAELALAELGPLIQPPSEQHNAPHWPSYSAALFDDRLVYISHKNGVEELYDLATDPTEAHDLSKLPASGPTLARFRSRLARILSPRPVRTDRRGFSPFSPIFSWTRAFGPSSMLVQNARARWWTARSARVRETPAHISRRFDNEKREPC